jgi:DNA-binding winged helix-turn-helix (wHTH) protein/TolB-like protein
MTEQTHAFFEFDAFRVDACKRLLLRGDEAVPLPPKVFDTLLVLIENGGRVVEKDELMCAVWPDTAVEENNLTQNVSAIRKALGERRDEHRFVVTVPGRGYSFVAEVTRSQRRNGQSVQVGNGHAGNGHEANSHQQTSQPTADAEAQTACELKGAGDEKVAESPHANLSSSDTNLPLTHAHLLKVKSRRLSLLTKNPRRMVSLIVLCGVVLVVLLAAWPRLRLLVRDEAAEANGEAVRSIAVLPFTPLGAGADDAYTGSGMADALITKLGNSRQITVRPTSAVLRYVGVAYDAREAGRALEVDSVLDGKIQRAGDRVRVTVQLVRVRDGATLWADTFDEKSTDIFAVEDSISEQVLTALDFKLSREEEGQLHKQQTDNVEAAQAFAKAHYFMNKATKEGVYKGLEYFERAVEIDPKYVRAYGGMADCYTRLRNYGVPPRESLLKGKAVALKAIEIDPSAAYAHSILGRIEYQYDWNFAGAEREYKIARQCEPRLVHQWYAFYLLLMNRTEEADREIKLFAAALPFLSGGNTAYARYFYYKREYDAALEQIRKTIEMERSFPPAHEMLGLIYERKGMGDDAVVEFQEAKRLSGGSVGAASLGYEWAVSGKTEKAREALRELEAQSKTAYVSPYDSAVIFAGLGETREAVAALEQARNEGSLNPADLRFDPRFDNLRATDAFQDFARRVGLPQ